MKTTGNLRILIALSVVCSTLATYGLYFYDNKYTTDNTGEPYVLVNDWKVYPDELLETTDGRKDGIPVWIGEYPDFSSFHADGNPFGTATYTTFFPYRGKEKTLTMYLQEPFSAVAVYINGELIYSQGSILPYHHDHSDALISFPAQSRNDILIQTRNETQYYSGLYYPPVIGSTKTAASIHAVRLSLYGGISLLCLTLALFSYVSGHRSSLYQNSFQRLSMLNCSMAVYALYPFFNQLFSSSTLPYIVENASMMLILYCAVSMVLSFLQGSTPPRYHVWKYFSLAMIPYAAFMPLLLPYIPSFRTLYGSIITLYKLTQAIFLFLVSFELCKKTHSNRNWLLAGSAVYGTMLSISQLLINRYEPIRTLWIEEYAVLTLVLLFAFVILSEIRNTGKEKRIFELHMQEEIEKRTHSISLLMEEYQQNIRYLLHDMKKPVSTAGIYLNLMNEADQQQYQKQLDILKCKFHELQHQLQALQNYNQISFLSLEFQRTRLDHFLQQFVAIYQADLDMEGTDMQLMMDTGCEVLCDENALLRVFQNLLYNSMEHAHTDALQIQLELTTDRNSAILYFRDNGKGIAKEIQQHIFDAGITSKKEEPELHGLGLYITASIIKRHGGEISVSSDKSGCEFCIKLPLAP